MSKNIDVSGVVIPMPTPTCEMTEQNKKLLRFDIPMALHIHQIKDSPKKFCEKLVELLSQHYVGPDRHVQVLKAQLRGQQILYIELSCMA